MAGGMAYETPSATTDAEMMALKALGLQLARECIQRGELYLDEPRKMQPKMTTKAVVRMSALSGISCFECTFAKKRLAGSPPSLQSPSVYAITLFQRAWTQQTWRKHKSYDYLWS